MNNKKEIINNIVSENINISYNEIPTQNSSNLKIVYKNSAYVNGLIKQAICKFSQEWSSDIIRDNTYYSFYRGLVKVAQEFDPNMIGNDEYMNKVLVLSQLYNKEDLILVSKKNSDGNMLEDTWEELISPIADEEGVNILELLVNQTIDSNNSKATHFLNWFNENKNEVLTKKQLSYINNELFLKRSTACEMRKRIAERVEKKYTEAYKNMSNRQKYLIDNKCVLETILSASHDNFKEVFTTYQENEFIIDVIIDNVPFAIMKKFNTTENIDTDIIRIYRTALFKALNNINNKLENEQ